MLLLEKLEKFLHFVVLWDFWDTLYTSKREVPVPSVLRCCWLGGRKGIRPVKNSVVGCWRGCLSGARFRLAYGPADAAATHSLASEKFRSVLPFWYRLTWVVQDKGPLNVCRLVVAAIYWIFAMCWLIILQLNELFLQMILIFCH